MEHRDSVFVEARVGVPLGRGVRPAVLMIGAASSQECQKKKKSRMIKSFRFAESEENDV